MSVNPRIASIENLIASDPGGRNVFGLVIADQLRLAAQSLRFARKVTIVSGFYICEAGAGETDGPPGAKVVGEALAGLGIVVDYVTDSVNAPLFRALDIEPVILPGGRRQREAPPLSSIGSSTGSKLPVAPAQPPSSIGSSTGSKLPVAPAQGVVQHVDGRKQQAHPFEEYLDTFRPTHLLSIERLGRAADGRYRNMRGVDVTAVTTPLDELILEAGRRGLTTIGIGDGGNEIGMGRVFADALAVIPHGRDVASTVMTDFCVAAGVSNWGAYGLAGALSVLEGRDLLPSADTIVRDLERMVERSGAVDGVTHRREPTVDGLNLSHSVRMLESIRRQIAPSPLERARPLSVGILGYGQAGRSAAALLIRHGHRVRISDEAGVTLERGTIVEGVETGGHTIGFFSGCDLIVASPGIRADAPILDALHRAAIPIMSELELAYQLCGREIIAVTGTIGKRTTVELLQRLFEACGQSLVIGGNRGRPLSALLLDDPQPGRETYGRPIAVAVSSFQLETVVHFRPHVAVLLNINEAHLDRHRSIAEYVRTKSRVFMNQRPDDILVLNFDDDRIRPLARKHQGRTLFVSRRQEVDRGAWLMNGAVHMNFHGRIECIAPAAPEFAENLLAAVVTAGLYGMSGQEIANALGRINEGSDTR